MRSTTFLFAQRLTALSLAMLAASCATAQLPQIPPRSSSAWTGSQILPLITSLSVQDRETLLWQEFASGNVPDFLRQFVTVRVTRNDAQGRARVVEFEVAPDYLAVGSDQDFFRMPMTPALAQQVADLLDCSLPTRRMVDDIWAAAPVKLAPYPFSPTQYNILAPSLFYQHHQQVEAQRGARPLGPIVAGIKKDVVVTARLATVQNRVAIYGWHYQNGNAIQPLSTVHVDYYADYSHGARMVRNRVLVDGAPTTVGAVIADPVLHPLLSDEGAFATTRYPTGGVAETFPFLDAVPASGLELASWRARFTPPQVSAMAPAAPRGDGYVVIVQDPRGGTDSLRLGSATTRDQVVQADVHCDYRPGLAANGFERVGVFARDRASGNFDGTQSGQGACYALAWDSNNGRLWCMRAAGGVLTDLLPQPMYLPNTAWRRMRIEARGPNLRFLVDGAEILATIDATHAQGEFGIGHHEFFATNANARGTRADNFFADIPDALAFELRTSPGGTVTFDSERGVPGDLYFRPVTLSPGLFPHGWFYGLDPTLTDLGSQLASAHPAFIGFFDQAGRAQSTLTNLPPGLTLYGVALDVHSLLPPVATSTPTTATTLP